MANETLIAELDEAANVAWVKLRRDCPRIPDTDRYRAVFRAAFKMGNIYGREDVVEAIEILKRELNL